DLGAATAIVGVDAATGGGDLDAVAVVGVVRPAAGHAVGGDGDHARAVAGRITRRVGALVARRDHDDRTQRIGLGDGVGLVRRAVAGAAEAQVDDVRRVGIGRHAFDLATCRPDDRIGDVGVVAAAMPEHADRQDVGVVGDAGHADAVVGGLRAGGACHVRAMPGAVALLAAFRARIADEIG